MFDISIIMSVSTQNQSQAPGHLYGLCDGQMLCFIIHVYGTMTWWSGDHSLAVV